MTRILWNGQENELKNLKLEKGILSGEVNGKIFSVAVVTDREGRVVAARTVNGQTLPVSGVTKGEHTWLQWEGVLTRVEFSRGRESGTGEEAGDGSITAPMPGKVLELKAAPGDKVEKDQVLVLMESMKLQVEIRSPFDGTVKTCSVSVGDMVDGGSLLMEITASQPE